MSATIVNNLVVIASRNEVVKDEKGKFKKKTGFSFLSVNHVCIAKITDIDAQKITRKLSDIILKFADNTQEVNFDFSKANFHEKIYRKGLIGKLDADYPKDKANTSEYHFANQLNRIDIKDTFSIQYYVDTAANVVKVCINHFKAFYTTSMKAKQFSVEIANLL